MSSEILKERQSPQRNETKESFSDTVRKIIDHTKARIQTAFFDLNLWIKGAGAAGIIALAGCSGSPAPYVPCTPQQQQQCADENPEYKNEQTGDPRVVCISRPTASSQQHPFICIPEDEKFAQIVCASEKEINENPNEFPGPYKGTGIRVGVRTDVNLRPTVRKMTLNEQEPARTTYTNLPNEKLSYLHRFWPGHQTGCEGAKSTLKINYPGPSNNGENEFALRAIGNPEYEKKDCQQGGTRGCYTIAEIVRDSARIFVRRCGTTEFTPYCDDKKEVTKDIKSTTERSGEGKYLVTTIHAASGIVNGWCAGTKDKENCIISVTWSR